MGHDFSDLSYFINNGEITAALVWLYPSGKCIIGYVYCWRSSAQTDAYTGVLTIRRNYWLMKYNYFSSVWTVMGNLFFVLDLQGKCKISASAILYLNYCTHVAYQGALAICYTILTKVALAICYTILIKVLWLICYTILNETVKQWFRVSLPNL